MRVSDFIEVRIYGQLFRLRAGSEKAYVQELADYVDSAMRLASKQSRAVSIERVAIMAALNIADAFFQQRRQSEAQAGVVGERINQLVLNTDRLLED